MSNMLLEDIEYQVTETPRGVWRRFMYPTGELFEEFVSNRRVLDMPFLHFTRGRSPETGKRVVANGFIAIGRVAFGVIAIGHASFGLIAIGQLSVGILLGLGQATLGMFALGQLAIGGAFGLGQVAVGYVALGQFGLGEYVLAQIGFGRHVWDMRGADFEAHQLFRPLFP
jgi:hypothetical protein